MEGGSKIGYVRYVHYEKKHEVYRQKRIEIITKAEQRFVDALHQLRHIARSVK